jgi:hypothetical protein
MRKTWLIPMVVLVALGFGIRRARAQSYEFQSFTAIETTTNRSVDLKFPSVENEIIAVSAGGNLVARLKRSEFGNASSVRTHWILNATEKTNILVDHGAKMKIEYPYRESFLLFVSHNRIGDHCDGVPAGQIEGLDVDLRESLGSAEPGNTLKLKVWLAPKLGCFAIREERHVTDKDGKFVRLMVHTLTNIEIGEPDPSYFDTSLPEGYTDTKPEDYRGALVNLKKAKQ